MRPWARASRCGDIPEQSGATLSIQGKIRGGRGPLQAGTDDKGESAWARHPHVATTLENMENFTGRLEKKTKPKDWKNMQEKSVQNDKRNSVNGI
jgi:hypothetical protein